MIESFLRPIVEKNPSLWFQQDGESAHTARQTMDLLREIFGERLILKNPDFPCPLRSPDLATTEFFYGDI
ncbi:hypothetical protein TNIN_213051 [Trichonephila inaurata madagascariensis]|uniref:Uncharacterized protein n=1 Tax=Trichonephila inaurata madagascariensis TaxID=2747483 RepID=A0A8X7C892_9ARAC|nr:hypothetical protein TNIN_213051 [Trichonephila inaurata madagascariensis]